MHWDYWGCLYLYANANGTDGTIPLRKKPSKFRAQCIPMGRAEKLKL
jgi:hypothetical protein